MFEKTEDRVIVAIFGGAMLYGALTKSWQWSVLGAVFAGMVAHYKQINGK